MVHRELHRNRVVSIRLHNRYLFYVMTDGRRSFSYEAVKVLRCFPLGYLGLNKKVPIYDLH